LPCMVFLVGAIVKYGMAGRYIYICAWGWSLEKLGTAVAEWSKLREMEFSITSDFALA